MKKGESWEKRLAGRFPEFDESAQSLEDFFSHWQFRHRFKDHGKPVAVCDLCGNTGLRYHYLVARADTGEALWVGSECILHFDVHSRQVQAHKHGAVRRDGSQNDEQIQEKTLGIIQQLQKVYMRASKSEKRRIRWVVGKFQHRGGFCPADLAWLFQVMAICGVRVEPSLYPLTLRTLQDKEEMKQLPVNVRRLIVPVLTEEQIQLCQSLGMQLDR